MNSLPAPMGRILENFNEELLRWNKQINLISRQDSGDRLAGLINQCLGGHEAVRAWLEESNLLAEASGGVCYFDLGSGGGLPGVVWHAMLNSWCEHVHTHLVEPREKRAWFLRRLNRIAEMPGFGVLQGRWGEVLVEEPGFPGGDPRVLLVSLKALHLDDNSVLRGLEAAFASSSLDLTGKLVLLARYYPPEQLYDQELVSQLNIPEPGGISAQGDYIYKATGGEVLGLGPSGAGLASLVLSTYEVQAGR